MWTVTLCFTSEYILYLQGHSTSHKNIFSKIIWPPKENWTHQDTNLLQNQNDRIIQQQYFCKFTQHLPSKSSSWD